MALNHRRLPGTDQRFLKSHGLETRFDPTKRRYYLYFRGRLISELSFSEGEWRSAYPATCVAQWKGKLSHLHFDGAPDFDSEDRERSEKVSQEADERFEFMAKEYVKYGVKGSQAPGPSSVVVDGFRK